MQPAGRVAPLGSLRVFEVAARHLSMSLAARELHMTQSAVSQHIRRLEAYLGVSLFHRQPGGLKLSAAGEKLFSSVSPAMASMAAATESIRRIASSGKVVLSTTAAVASRWLLPRVRKLESAVPNVSLQVDVSRSMVKFGRDDVDLAIRFGEGRWTGVRADRLLTLREACLAAHTGTRGSPRMTIDRILKGKVPLLCDPHHDYWSTWAQRHGVDRAQLEKNMLLLDDFNVVVQALLDGLGVAIVPLCLVVDQVLAKQLYFVDPEPLVPDGGYWLVYPQSEEGRKSVRSVMQWLEDEARDTERRVDGVLAEVRG